MRTSGAALATITHVTRMPQLVPPLAAGCAFSFFLQAVWR
jgi:hypothetical protein